jgi:hypothetical protein
MINVDFETERRKARLEKTQRGALPWVDICVGAFVISVLLLNIYRLVFAK